MRIVPLVLFKHGQQTYHPGEIREVSDLDAGLFLGNGWAAFSTDEVGRASAPVPPVAAGQDHTLDIHDLTHTIGG